MRWYEEVTKDLIAFFKKYSFEATYQIFGGPRKLKINREKMNDIFFSSLCKGGLCVLDDIMSFVEKEEKEGRPVDKDFIMGQIHLYRMNLVNTIAEVNGGPRIGLETAMILNPPIEKLMDISKITIPKIQEYELAQKRNKEATTC